MSTTDPKDVAKSLNLLIIHTLLVEWVWQGGLDPFGIFIWPHPLTLISSKIVYAALATEPFSCWLSSV